METRWEKLSQVERRIFRVGELTRAIRLLLEEGFPFLWVEGEISNFKASASGHFYFTLKDEEASLRAVLFRSYRPHLRFRLEDGLHVLCWGRISVYEPRGEYQLLVQHVEPLGYGAVQLALTQLKEKLAAQGYFAQERKRPLPFFPRKLGVITSLNGAAIRDFLRIALSRCPKANIIIFPVRVQGKEAAQEIAQGVRTLSRWPGVEVVVITRGGGSIEDLWAFNEEIVAKEVFDAPVPVVSAVGHEIDFTICDLVADLRVPTPTAAAQQVFPDLELLEENLRLLTKRLTQNLEGRLKQAQQELRHLLYRLPDPRQKIREGKKRHEELSWRLLKLWEIHFSRQKSLLQTLVRQLETLSPLQVLARGYSITRSSQGQILKDSRQVSPGDKIEITLHRGEIKAEVKEVLK